MKKHILTLTLSIAFALSSVNGSETTPSLAELARLRQNYEESLNSLIEKHLDEENVAAVAEIAAELQRIQSSIIEEESELPHGSALIGSWRWHNNFPVIIKSNGLTIMNDQSYGIWKWSDEKKRTGTIYWETGYVVSFTLSPNGKNLHLVNNLDRKHVAKKIESKE